MALITCENVSIGYEGQTVVKELNFSIERGDYLCIVGENGSGKSTLVKSLLGLKGADRGKIIYGDGLKKNEIGYLPQKNEEQKGFPASVYEVVLSGRLNGRGWKPFYRKEDKKLQRKRWKCWGSQIWRVNAFGIFRVDSSKERFLQGRFVRRKAFFYLMNL